VKYIELAGTSLKPSVLGFGCASIMGSVGKAQSLRALQSAYEAGINYFDVARSYGYGEAEKLLGEFTRGKRENIYIATKFGIAPSVKTQLLGKFKPVVRATLSVVPQARKLVGKQAMSLNSKGNFSVSSAKTSLETSLRCLGTDYIDVLLLHGCTLADCLNDELLEFLEKCVKDGKVRYLGIATGMDETLEVLAKSLPLFRIIQIKNSVFERNLTRVSSYPNTSVIAHSPFGGGLGLQKLREIVDDNPELLSAWFQELRTSSLTFNDLAALTFQYAISCLEEKGIVLGSMFQERHIKANTQIIDSSIYSQEKVTKFADLIEKGLPT